MSRSPKKPTFLQLIEQIFPPYHPKGPTFVELAQQALSSTERGYDLLAPKFEYTPFRTPDEILQASAKQLEPLAPFDAGLDLCCGTGAAMRILRPLCRERVVGIDFSQGMLDVGQQLTAGASGTARLEFVRGNVLDMPFGQVFDIAVCFGALGHILPRDEPRFIAEIYRVLKPGGRFVFVTTYLPSVGSPWYWLARGFNAAMHVRNWLFSPPFIMYYLTFLLPDVAVLLRKQGFAVEERGLGFKGLAEGLRLVIATRT